MPITNLINAAFHPAEQFFVVGLRVDRESVESFLAKGKILLAETEGHIVGCVYVEPRHAGVASSYLGLLSVDPNSQQSGLGSLLMNAAERYCCALGCRSMDIKVVNLREELLGFYERRGYRKTGTSSFPHDVETRVPCHFIEMSKPLAPE